MEPTAIARAQTYCACHPKRFSMNYYPILIIITIILVGVAGCTQSAAPAPARVDNQTVKVPPGGNETVSQPDCCGNTEPGSVAYDTL